MFTLVHRRATPRKRHNFGHAVLACLFASGPLAATPVLLAPAAQASLVPAVATPAPLTISTQTVPSMRVGVKAQVHLAAQGGRAPYSWRLASGSLPPGLHLASKGEIYGTPTVPGTPTVSVEVVDSSRPTPATASTNITLQILPAPLRVTTKSLPGGSTGSLYNAQLGATGGVAPYNWKLWTGLLPPGLSLSSSGGLSGTPTNRGDYRFQIQLNDSASPANTTIAAYSVVISTPQLRVATRSLPFATVSQGYSVQLQANGGFAPYTWAMKSGQLPNGISLSSSGLLSGTATNPGTFHFTVRVSDASGDPMTAKVTYKLKVVPVPLAIANISLPAATVGSPYSATFDASGGASPYFWSLVKGSLPSGLQLSSSGSISGTPLQPGTFRFSVRAKDSSPRQLSNTRNFRLVVTPVALVVGTTGLPVASLNNPYAAALATTGGTAPFTWTITAGALPPGITMSSAGYIAGITATPGAFTFTVRVTDSSPARQSATAQLTLLAGSGAANWSGYVDTGNYTEVAGTFVVPTTLGAAQGPATTCPSVCPSVAQWVGLDGLTNSQMVQAGVEEQSVSGSVTITPYWEILPSNPVTIPITVSGGDKITVTIFEASTDEWAIALDDDTTGQLFRTLQAYSGPATTADFVVEAPSATVGGAVLPLASYKPATNFTNLQTVGTTSATAAIVLVQGGVQVSTPSVITPIGFAVAYGSIAPSPPS